MGFLSRIFGSAKPESYSLDEAMKIIESELQTLRSANKEEQYKTAIQVNSEMEKLYSLIGDFSRKDVPEMAKSSANVKERFCSISIRQINSLPEPSSEEPWKYLDSVQSILNNLGGLTQRQIIHINFFFKDDFSQAGHKINEINAMLKLKQEGNEHMKSTTMYRKIKDIEKRKKEIHESILRNQEKLKTLEEQKQSVPNVVEHTDTNNLEEAGKTLKTIRQEIDSFLGVQKLMKKYAYTAELNDELLDTYIESPNRAILEDETLKILDYVRSAVKMVREGKINEDLSEDKINNILSGEEYLRRKREELIKAIQLVRTEEKTSKEKRNAFEEKLKIHNNMLSHFDGEIKTAIKLIETEKEEEEILSKDLAKTYSDLCMLASKILNSNIS